jgi:hypothetical protein
VIKPALVGLAAPVGILIDGGNWGGGSAIVAKAGLLSEAKATKFRKRHVHCATGQAQLMNAAQYPTEIGTLPTAMQDRLSRQSPPGEQLDLSPIGYQFYRAGDCRIPGKDSVHVLYRAPADARRRDAISLWVRSSGEDVTIEANKLYNATSPESAHPILMWKHAGLVYYLVGDSPDRAQDAAQYLFTASR